MTTPARQRTVTITETTAPTIVVPRGRSAAERRLAALAALHQPIPRTRQGIAGVYPDEVIYVCGECKVAGDIGRLQAARWPCTTARMMGTWPGETE